MKDKNDELIKDMHDSAALMKLGFFDGLHYERNQV